MRLLEYDSGSIQVTDDLLDSEIPPYAILSHTWGHRTEELTFQDIKNSTGRNKAGFRKIEFCGSRAAQDGYSHFWVDSCCIDKTNAVELQEAITSMYKWYQRARKCYVYLSDVTAMDPANQETWAQAFRGSRYFTRGWTLQELLASRVVEFYSQEQKLLGSKETLEALIHEITGIPINALRGMPMSTFNVQERLSWARHRHTMREEDGAYSLLGIFGVSIPAIYGEGRQHALQRLRIAIREFGEDGAETRSESRSSNQENLGRTGWGWNFTSWFRRATRDFGEEEPKDGLQKAVPPKTSELQAVVHESAQEEAMNLPKRIVPMATTRISNKSPPRFVAWQMLSHNSDVSSVAFSADGKTLASGTRDRNVRLWDISSGQLRMTYMGHKKGNRGLAFSPDGKILASSSPEGMVIIRDVRTAELLQTLKGYDARALRLAFSPSGILLATSSYIDKTVRIWDVRHGAVLRKITGHTDGVLALAFSPDGQSLATACIDRRIRLWNVQTGAQEQQLGCDYDFVSHLAYLSDGKTLVSCSSNCAMTLWDSQAGTVIGSYTRKEPAVSAMALAPGGRTLASGSIHGTVKLWTGQETVAGQMLEGHKDCVNAMAFSPDGEVLASASKDQTVRLWKRET